MPTGTLEEAQARFLTTPVLDDSEPEVPTESVEAVADTGPEVAENTEEATEAAASEVETLYSVSVAGEEKEVTLDELRSGYMMQSDYSRKTQELAEQRKQDEASREALQSKLEQAELVAQMEGVDLNSSSMLELKETDPVAYYERKEAHEERARKIEELRADVLAQKDAKRQARIKAEQELLIPAIPEWVNPEKMSEEVPLIQKTWAEAGFTAEDVQDFIDHRWLVISRKAALYDRIANAKPEDKKVTTTPKSAEPGAATIKDDSPSQAAKERRERLRKTGRPGDAQRAILDILRK